MRCWPRHGTSWRTTVFLLGASPARTTRFTCVQYLGFGEAGIGSSSVPRATEVMSVQGTTTNSGPMSTSCVGQDYLTAGDRRGKGVLSMLERSSKLRGCARGGAFLLYGALFGIRVASPVACCLIAVISCPHRYSCDKL